MNKPEKHQENSKTVEYRVGQRVLKISPDTKRILDRIVIKIPANKQKILVPSES